MLAVPPGCKQSHSALTVEPAIGVMKRLYSRPQILLHLQTLAARRRVGKTRAPDQTAALEVLDRIQKPDETAEAFNQRCVCHVGKISHFTSLTPKFGTPAVGDNKSRYSWARAAKREPNSVLHARWRGLCFGYAEYGPQVGGEAGE